MPSPAAERGAGVVVLDGTPEASCALVLATFDRDAREETDAEDASGAITQLLGDLERLARTGLGLVDLAIVEEEPCQLRQRSALPPRRPCFARQRGALADEVERAALITLVARDRAKCSGGLGEAPYVAPALVDRVARLDQLTRAVPGRLATSH